jgi:5-methylcytosine-specific restriction endonuclease McrA
VVKKKKCSKCGEIKELSDFYKDSYSKDGRYSICKLCKNKATKKYRESNPEKDRIRKLKWAKNNLIKSKEIDKRYRQSNAIYTTQAYKLTNIEAPKLAKDGKSLEVKCKYCGRYFCPTTKKVFHRVEAISGKINSSQYLYCSNICKTRDNTKNNYIKYSKLLTIDESIRISKDNLKLEVKCKYCGKYFTPLNRKILQRIQSLNGRMEGDCYLYCSTNCKSACPVYGQKTWPKTYKKATSREVQPQLRQTVLERDNWTCQKCGRTTEEVELHCHHIFPLNESPIESADVENCITLCKNCHKEAHKLPGCNYYELQCSE